MNDLDQANPEAIRPNLEWFGEKISDATGEISLNETAQEELGTLLNSPAMARFEAKSCSIGSIGEDGQVEALVTGELGKNSILLCVHFSTHGSTLTGIASISANLSISSKEVTGVSEMSGTLDLSSQKNPGKGGVEQFATRMNTVIAGTIEKLDHADRPVLIPQHLISDRVTRRLIPGSKD